MTSAPIDIKLSPRNKSRMSRAAVAIHDLTADSGDRHTQNPAPYHEVEADPSDVIMEEYLSPRRLRELAKTDDLESVEVLEMQVDSTETSLGNFGSLLPNLKQLKLNNSLIESMRDLGSCLDNLSVLMMSHCQLKDLDGVCTMMQLKELYLPYNLLSDISSLSMLEKLRILDLEGNCLDSISQVEFLGLCLNLTHLTVEGNPLCQVSSPQQEKIYRLTVKQKLPQITHLDDIAFSPDECKLAEKMSGKPQFDDRTNVNEPDSDVVVITPRGDANSSSNNCRSMTSTTGGGGFHDDWRLIEELRREGTFVSADSGLDSPNDANNASSGKTRPLTAASFLHCRPGSAARQTRPRVVTTSRQTTTGSVSSGDSRTTTPAPGRDIDSPTSLSRTTPRVATPLSISDLTRGDVVCGGPRALRAARRHAAASSASTSSTTRGLTPRGVSQMDAVRHGGGGAGSHGNDDDDTIVVQQQLDARMNRERTIEQDSLDDDKRRESDPKFFQSSKSKFTPFTKEDERLLDPAPEPDILNELAHWKEYFARKSAGLAKPKRDEFSSGNTDLPGCSSSFQESGDYDDDELLFSKDQSSADGFETPIIHVASTAGSSRADTSSNTHRLGSTKRRPSAGQTSKPTIMPTAPVPDRRGSHLTANGPGGKPLFLAPISPDAVGNATTSGGRKKSSSLASKFATTTKLKAFNPQEIFDRK